MPATVFPGLVDEQTPSDSVTALAKRYGVLLGKAEERLSIGESALEVAEALAIAVKSPVMLLDRVIFALDDRPVEWRLGWCHIGDKHYFAETD